MRINELFDTNYDYSGPTLGDMGENLYQFTTDAGEDYTVHIFLNAGTLQVHFQKVDEDGEYGGGTGFKTGTGDEFKVFSTVVNIAKKFFEDNYDDIDTYALMYSTDENKRKEIYAGIIKRLMKEYPEFKYTNTETGVMLGHNYEKLFFVKE